MHFNYQNAILVGEAQVKSRYDNALTEAKVNSINKSLGCTPVPSNPMAASNRLIPVSANWFAACKNKHQLHQMRAHMHAAKLQPIRSLVFAY